MAFRMIAPDEIRENPFGLLAEQWGLVTAADGDGANPMTVSWGGMGILWNKPVTTIYIRPQRYTHDLLEKTDYFTLSFYDDSFREALRLCGTKSGRDLDKASAAGLTLISDGNFRYYEEAKLVLCCKKIYCDHIIPEKFLSDDITASYPEHDYHDFYIGEILSVLKKD